MPIRNRELRFRAGEMVQSCKNLPCKHGDLQTSGHVVGPVGLKTEQTGANVGARLVVKSGGVRGGNVSRRG